MDLIGAQEIADLFGVTRQRVGQLARTDPTFPDPVAEMAAGRIWERKLVEKWETRRVK